MEGTLKLVDFSTCRRFLVMGCGRVPATLFHLHDRTDIECLVGIDRDPQSLALARQLGDRFGLRRIRIVEADAGNMNYAGFDIICWAPFALLRRKIMARVAATAHTSWKVPPGN
jgi:SAM-dependent methyltransferase